MIRLCKIIFLNNILFPWKDSYVLKMILYVKHKSVRIDFFQVKTRALSLRNKSVLALDSSFYQ